MPPGGHPARAEALATIEPHRAREVRRRRDRTPARAPATARGVARLRLGRREPHPRHAPRLGEAAPRPDRAPRRADPRGGARQPGLDRGARDERLREVPSGARAQPRPEAPLRRVLRVGGLAVHAAPRRLRAVHEDVRGRRGVRDDPARPRRARARGAARRRVVPRAAVPGRRAGGVLRADPRHARPRGGLVPPRSDRAPVLHVVLARATCA